MHRRRARRQSTPCLMTVLSGFIGLVVISAAGLILGVGLWFVSELGYFQHWTQLSVDRREAPGYLAAARNSRPPAPPGGITDPCDFSTSEFSLLANPPKDIVDCVQRLEVYADGDGRVTYVIDSDGRIWQWEFVRSASSGTFMMMAWALSGLLIGGVVGLIAVGLSIYLHWRRTSRRHV